MKEYAVVYNACFGGFSLSYEAVKKLCEKKGIPYNNSTEHVSDYDGKISTLMFHDIERHDKDLISVVEELGVTAASGDHAKLHIQYMDSNMYKIDEYDGKETVEQNYDNSWIVIPG
jgi:hypothetical protein